MWAFSCNNRLKIRSFYNKRISPGAQGSKLSRTGPKGLKVVSNWEFCAEFENQCLTCRNWEVFLKRRHCCHGNKFTKHLKCRLLEAGILLVDV